VALRPEEHLAGHGVLEGGVSIRAVAEYLGHSDPGFTLRVYAHLMPEAEDRARSAVDVALGSLIEARGTVAIAQA